MKSAAITSIGRLESYGQSDCSRVYFPHLITSLSVFLMLLSAHHQDLNDRVKKSQGLLISGQVRATERVRAELMQLFPKEIPVAPLASVLRIIGGVTFILILIILMRFLGLPRSLGPGCASLRLSSKENWGWPDFWQISSGLCPEFCASEPYSPVGAPTFTNP
jgi:hypothetical protein